MYFDCTFKWNDCRIIMSSVKLVKNRDLLDPTFSGYKLSLDNIAVTNKDLPQSSAPVHINPSSDEYRWG